MISANRMHLSSYLTELLSSGKAVFSRDEAVRDLGSSRGAFLDAAERLQRRGQLVNPKQGFYVVVPPQFLSWGAPPPSWYVDDLMRREEHPYYVGLLAAATLHGATHHAVMEFQVVTDKKLAELLVGRSRIAFYYRKDMAAVAAGIEGHKTETGRMKVSSVELTVLDLLRYPRAGGRDRPHSHGLGTARRQDRAGEIRQPLTQVRATGCSAPGPSTGTPRPRKSGKIDAAETLRRQASGLGGARPQRGSS